jgi:hypothetical protein
MRGKCGDFQYTFLEGPAEQGKEILEGRWEK